MKTIFTPLILYRIAKGFIIFLILFSAYYSFTHASDFRMLGFPNYFRIQLSILKLVGAIALLVPSVPLRVREWVYVAFVICMSSALVAHIFTGDPFSKILFVSIDTVLFILSAVTVQRFETARIDSNATTNQKLTN